MSRPERLFRASGPRSAGTLAVTALLVGCAEETPPPVTIAHPTLVEVSPGDFLGSVPCTDAPGAMRRYVATVYDADALDAPDDESSGGAATEETSFALPSSTLRRDGEITATPCTQNVGFARVVQGHHYWAEIEGYDRDDLVALAPGTRILYDKETSERVAPRWTTTCSKETPVAGLSQYVRRIANCEPLEDAAPRGETAVEVSVDGALDGLLCGTGDGEVERYEVTRPDGVVVGAACGETLTFTELGANGATLALPLHAFEAGSVEPTWGTTCLARVIQGVTTSASCPPLASVGALDVAPEDALGALDLACDASSFVELEIAIDTSDAPEPHYVSPSECSRLVTFQSLEAGLATARASVRFADGSRSGNALCTGEVVPGGTVRATCAAEP